MPIKNFNPNEEKEEIINGTNKSLNTKDVLFRKANMVVESSQINFSYLIFSLQKVCQKYGIDYDECIMLMYLQELGLFSIQLKVLKRTVRLGDYLLKELIVEDYSHKNKKLYRLSDVGKDIVKEIYSNVSDNTRYVGENRSTDLGVDTKVTAMLSKYFSKK